ncbi:DUF927 domain-containing protein [Fundidesulfovibrio butyratiphilus]
MSVFEGTFTVPASIRDVKLGLAARIFSRHEFVAPALERPRDTPKTFEARERLIAHVGLRVKFDDLPGGGGELLEQDIVSVLAQLWHRAGRDFAELTKEHVFALLDQAEWEYRNDHTAAMEYLSALPDQDEDSRQPQGDMERFVVRSDGVFFVPVGPKGRPLSPEWVCSPLAVPALTRDLAGAEWGRLVELRDAEGRTHELALPARLLAGGGELFEELLSHGLVMDNRPVGRQRLNEFLTKAKPDVLARCVPRIGWHGQGPTRTFVLPGAVFGHQEERIVLQADTSGHSFRVAGSLQDWRESVGRYCVGNTRLVLAVSTALAAPLLALAGAESSIVNLHGISSSGKTTALHVAGSVWGGGGVTGYLRSWRTTTNALEGTALGHCDCLLCLDELSQADPLAVSESAYMLANGAGKTRADRRGNQRPPAEWRVMCLSSGELTLESRMRESTHSGSGGRHKAGQGVRVLDVPACPEGGHGVFEELHGAESGHALARHLGDATSRLFGTPSRAFLETLVQKPEEAEKFVREVTRRFIEGHTCPRMDGQVIRVAARFGLLAAAGELGTRAGVLPWPAGEAMRGVGACFASWLEQRGTSGPQEIDRGVRQVVAWFQKNHLERFPNIKPDTRGDVKAGDAGSAPQALAWPATTRSLSGYRLTTETGEWIFYVFPETFREEICQGFDHKSLVKELTRRGMLEPDGSGKATTQIRVPGGRGRVRLYKLNASILDGGEDGQ